MVIISDVLYIPIVIKLSYSCWLIKKLYPYCKTNLDIQFQEIKSTFGYILLWYQFDVNSAMYLKQNWRILELLNWINLFFIIIDSTLLDFKSHGTCLECGLLGPGTLNVSKI